MKKLKKFFKHVFGFVAIFIWMMVSFSLAYFIEGYFDRTFGYSHSDYVRHLLTTILGFLIIGILGFFFGKAARSKEFKKFQEVIDALKRIARGDFNIHLRSMREDHPFATLIEHINHMAKQLKEMEDMRQEFISNVSHEIQSPLTSISGFARALQYDQLSAEEHSHYLSIIETETRRLSKLSDNLLKLTSLESEHHPFERKQYRLDTQIRDIILACEVQWSEKDLEMDVSLEKLSIVADEGLMSQVWTNIIHNSIKFTPQGGRIAIDLHQEGERAVIRISDTGVGMSKIDQVHAFERFYKADKARDRSKGGNGLGLSIVKKILDMHEATILVESEEGKGSTFTIIMNNQTV